MGSLSFPLLLLFLCFFFQLFWVDCRGSHDYIDALSKSILFFEGQRSGRLPPEQRVTWRRESAVSDGAAEGIDLEGGYYDAGDNIKFGFPMAFTTTMLAWSLVEFGKFMPPSEFRQATIAVRWATDYLLKTISQPDKIFVQVGDPIQDHNCWERPEDMDTARTVYIVDKEHPGSDVAGETAAALAAASMALRSSDPIYAERLLQNAIKALNLQIFIKELTAIMKESEMEFARFTAISMDTKMSYYGGAAWLSRASENETYRSYIQNNGKTLGAEDNINEFGWDNKHAGLNVLVAKEFLEGNILSLQSYKESADSFMCTLVPESNSPHIEYTPGGLIYKPGGSNMQHVTSIAFLLLSYANYLSRSSQSVNCGNVIVSPVTLRLQAKKQVDYMLGDNPQNMSYMVGYGDKYPQRIHHRGSSLPSVESHPQFIACKEGSLYYKSLDPNPNIHIGAVVGGPDENDVYLDDRVDFRQSEPTTYINAPLVGVLAYFVSNPTS